MNLSLTLDLDLDQDQRSTVEQEVSGHTSVAGGGPGGLFYLVLDMVADLAGFVVVNAEAAAVIVPDLGDLAGLFEALDNIHFAHFHH